MKLLVLSVCVILQTSCWSLSDASSDSDAFPDALDIHVGNEIRKYNSGLYTGSGSRIRAGKGNPNQPSSSVVRRTGLSTGSGDYLKTNEVMHLSASASEPDPVRLNLRGSRCRAGQYYCSWDDRCIRMDKRCNGYTDCGNGEDEKDCTMYLRNHVPLPESGISMPEPAALLSSSSRTRVAPQSLRQPVRQVLTTTTTTSTAAPVREKETDAPRINPVWDWSAPWSLSPASERRPETTTTTTTTPPPLVGNTLSPRTRYRWTAYTGVRRTTPAYVTEPGMNAQTVSQTEKTTTTGTALGWDTSYDQRLPVPESVPKELVKQEKIGTNAKILPDPGRNRGTDHPMTCQCTCSPSLF